MAKSSLISKGDVENAQERWRWAIIEIGAAFTNGQNYVAVAEQKIDELYAYGKGQKVLFKPTKCAERQFRLTAEGALSYFVGDASAPAPASGSAGFPEDAGFAISPPYIDVRFANADFVLEKDYALAMGNYYFTKATGALIKVEYTFGYRLIGSDLFIELHHSSLPYNPHC